MSTIDKQRQDVYIKEKQMLLYYKNIGISSVNTHDVEKVLAQARNIIIFLLQPEIYDLNTVTLLQLLNTTDDALSDIYSPAIMSQYSHKHKEFNNELKDENNLLKQNYLEKFAQEQYNDLQKNIVLIRNKTVQEWLNASIAYRIMEPRSFAYIIAKETLTQLHLTYPHIIPKPRTQR